MSKVTRLDYCQFLLVSQTNYTLTYFAEHGPGFSHDAVKRYLEEDKLTARMVWESVRGQVVRSENGYLAFDDTVLDHNTAFKIELVQRQYSGTAGRIENCPIGVFLAYASGEDYTLLDRELYLPEEWAKDTQRRQHAGIADAVTFATKPALACQMLERAFTAGIPARWVTADSIYGRDGKLRRLLEERGQAYVLAVTKAQAVWYGFEQQSVETLAATGSESGWQRLSWGEGAKGERLYDWALMRLSRWLPVDGYFAGVLTRRSLSDGDRAYFLVFAPQGTSLDSLVRVAGSRWKVEECFELAKGAVGLDQYEVRHWTGWYRPITLSMLALAFLTMRRRRTRLERRPKKRRGRPARASPQAQRSRNPSAAGASGLDPTSSAWTGAGLVSLATG